MGKGSGQTIGYHYLFSLLFGIGRGPLNALVAIKVADKVAWESEIAVSGPSAINVPELFGGEKKEGGVQGPFHFNMGEADQVLPGPLSINVGTANPIFSSFDGPYGGTRTLPGVRELIASETGDSLISQFRGVATLWFDGLISSMSPYPKEWKFRVRRHTAGWLNDTCWYPDKCAIYMSGGTIEAMNPAHIIYQCLTDPSWGRGLDPDVQIDENSFIYAANLLCEENFGLCLRWMQKEDIDSFIQIVLDHIGGMLYGDPETGKETLRLIRDDYVSEDLPVFAPGSGLVEISEDDSSSQDNSFNEIIGTGHDPITDEDFQLRVPNLAARFSNGAPNADDKSYVGIPTRDLLARVLQRDLKSHASGLKKFTVVLDRSGFKIRPGMVFRIQDPRRGIADITLRAGEIEDVSFKAGRIAIKAMQDVFSLPTTAFVTPPESTWAPPAQEAEPAAAERLIEAGYRDILHRAGPLVAEALDAEDALVGQLALSPNSASYEYQFATRVDGEPEFVAAGIGSFTGAATLAVDVAIFDTTFIVENMSSFSTDNETQAIMVGDELMELVSLDEVTGEVEVVRGCADTIPAAHTAGDYVWTIDDDLVLDTRQYAPAETVEGVVLTRTLSDMLAPSEATIQEIEVVGRQCRPYPPANVKVDTTLALTNPVISYSEPVISWAHRDRLVQEDALLGYIEASVGPEPGTTYNIRIYDPADLVTPLRETTGIATDSWTYDEAMQAVDVAPSIVYVEIESERDGLTSWKVQGFNVHLKLGYGYGYGLNYGGA